MKTTSKHLRITGRVQGVGYRNYMAYKAGQWGISGWVRNRNDGSVEVMVQGPETAVAAIIECAQRGPRASQVSGVTVGTVAAAEDFNDRFETRETA